MTPESKQPEQKKRTLPWKRILALLILLLLLLLLLRSCVGARGDRDGLDGSAGLSDSAALADSLRRADSLSRSALLDALRAAGFPDSLLLGRNLSASDLRSLLDSLRSTRTADSLTRLRALSSADSARLLDSLRRADSLARARRTLRSQRDSSNRDGLPEGRGAGTSRLDSLRRATGDSIPPVVFADPGPGIHPAPIDVALIVMEPKGTPLCGARPDDLQACRNLIRVTSSLELWISGEDSIGNRSEPRELRWRIDPDASRCGTRRALVPLGDGREVCVDAYEYPNDPSQIPRTSVNWEDASSLCRREGKRLCSQQELLEACRGPEEWNYPYGGSYALNYCQVIEGKLGRGVGRPACRSWWGAYGLIGNAWEWTSTPAPNPVYMVTSGGTYEGGPNTRCGRTSRSFRAQNSYEAVGFRCCEDLAK